MDPTGEATNVVVLRVLGPVEIQVRGSLFEAGPPQQRHVLAALAVDVGRTVPTKTIIDRVWDEAPPGARGALHVHFTRIRQMLTRVSAADGTPVRLLRRSGGYALDLDPGRVDLHRFQGLVDRARDPNCAAAERVGLLRAALALWHGEALSGLTGQWATWTRQNYAQQLLDATVAWAYAELRAGDPARLIGPLSGLVSEHPLAEQLAAVLMRALHATGQTAAALGQYTAARERLVEQLGTDPGPELRAAHQETLRGDPDPAATGAMSAQLEGTSAVQARIRPVQLPLDRYGFVGRTGELAQLDAILAKGAEQPNAVIVAVLSGTAGVGKTTLAVHWAHQASDRFPDGQLYVNLRGFDPTGAVMDPAQAIRGFLDALGVPAHRVPYDVDAQIGLYRSEIAGRRVLVVLDNAREADQVRPLLPGSPTAVVLVTSRRQLTGLVTADGAHPLTVHLFTDADAQALLAARLSMKRLAAEPEATRSIISRSARLPLALAIVAARAATHPDLPLAALAAELSDGDRRLDAVADEDAATDLRTVFSWSYNTLSRQAAQLFRQLGLAPGPDIGTAAVSSLAGMPTSRIRPLLAEMAGAHLTTEHTLNRYTFHDLLRAYSIEQAQAVDDHADRQSATHRVLDHYLHTAYTAARLLNPNRNPIALALPTSGVELETMANHLDAWAWFMTEWPVLAAAVDTAASAGFHTHAWQLAWTLSGFLERQGRWHEWAATHRTALDCTRQTTDLAGQAEIHGGLGRAYGRLRRFDDAYAHLQTALDLFATLNDVTGQASIHGVLGLHYSRSGQIPQALQQHRLALELFRAAGVLSGQANATNNMGWDYANLGDYRQALRYCEEAFALHQTTGSRPGKAATWHGLGYIHHHLGHQQQAIRCYQQALSMFRELGNRYHEADTLHDLGDAYEATGNLNGAHDAWRQALLLLQDLGEPDADRVRSKLHRLDPPAR